MANAIVKKDLINVVAEKCGTTKVLAGKMIDSVFDGIEKELIGGNDVFISGFGKLKTQVRPARTARNPATGDPVEVPAKNLLKYKPSRTLKAALNG